MRKLLAIAAAAVAIATAGLMAGIAVAQGNGNDGSQPNGQAVGWSNNHGTTTVAVTSTTSTEAGVKPSNTTKKWQTCTTGSGSTCPGNGKSDASKRYGNGKTAAQIVTERGAPAGTKLTGPGNSQPHKVTGCGLPNNRSGGVDVHAYKAKSCPTTTTAAATTTQAATTTAPATTTTEQTTTTTAAATGVINTPPVASGVLGATKALKAAAKPHARAGVLGSLKTLGAQGTLPFTGLRLWLVELIALGLIGAGVAMRLVSRRRTN